MRAAPIVGVACLLSAFGCTKPAPAVESALVLPACYRLSYAEWGEPPVTDAEALKGFRAPILVQLLDEGVPRSYAFIEDSSAQGLLWVREVADTIALPGVWRRHGGDTITMNFGGHPGLFGVSGLVHRRGDSLVGYFRTYTDVIGLEQGSSGLIGRPLPCAMPPRWSDPLDPEPDSGATPGTAR